MESKTINITIHKDKFPKLFDIDDNLLQDNLLYLLNIGYQNTYSSVVDNNIIDKVDNICRKFKDDILQGMQIKENNITSNIAKVQDNIKELNIDTKIDEVNDVINKLFGISTTSMKKGEISEDLIYKIINEKYPNYTYDVKSHIPHHADGELSSSSGMKCLVEIKNYSNTVNKDEIEKFKFDLKYTNNKLGIFLSLKTGIVGKNCIDYETFQNNNEDCHIIYISRLMEDINKLDCGFLLLENLFNIIKNDNMNLKIDQVKKMIYENFTNLEDLTNKTSKLRNNYNLLEKNIKSNLDSYYNDLREYDLDLKQKMQNVWNTLFNDLENVNTSFVDEKEKILLLFQKDKCYLILSKVFDILDRNNINVKSEDDTNIYNLYKKSCLIGYIKKMKDKISYQSTKVNISIVLSEKEDYDKNLEFIDYILKN